MMKIRSLWCSRWSVAGAASRRVAAGRTLGVIAAAFLTVFSSSAMADHLVGHRSVGSIDVYFGVLPADMIRGHPRAHPESAMHGGVADRPLHHVSVALFERETGRRIRGARVEAQVFSEAGSGPKKVLEPMVAKGAELYGNYFSFGGGAHRVRVWVRLPGSAKPLTADFDWGRT